jgi:hypothetical protein
VTFTIRIGPQTNRSQKELGPWSVLGQKWEPVLRPGTRQIEELEQDDDSKKSHLAPMRRGGNFG